MIKKFENFTSSSSENSVENFLLIFDNLSDSHPNLRIDSLVYDEKSDIHVDLDQSYSKFPPDGITVYIKDKDAKSKKGGEFKNIKVLQSLIFCMDHSKDPVEMLRNSKFIKNISVLCGYNLSSVNRFYGEIYLYFHKA